MRAWKMTAGLAVVALVAALLAPRLFPQVVPSGAFTPVSSAAPQVQPVVTVGEVEPHRVSQVPVRQPRLSRQAPIPPRVPEVPAIPARHDTTTTGIPELSTPIVPTPPDPALDEAWLNMVDCGMG